MIVKTVEKLVREVKPEPKASQKPPRGKRWIPEVWMNNVTSQCSNYEIVAAWN
jgi:hypothetical protein